ncbi:hypothetical protein KORDIASMS9_03762 [Kordia sp. SMS9]|uniref:T9SS type A sorting domain-containing protein n=1 Tax=Kordia sp. SMS9 TaxID=2282170 RepID=UPI000E1012E9|nr:T9SS type A sorting domain-containing protein [Kordia sp. SMS9]AXG71505.1 hypothetical protein KORDIASMS9_03762 [Kordia sp. SMS9]
MEILSRSSSTTATVSNLYDVDRIGNTIFLASSYYRDVMLIGPRLNNLSLDSSISLWLGRGSTNSVFNYLEYGFMTDPDDHSTFTVLGDVSPTFQMTQYFANVSNYNESYGKNFAIRVRNRSIYMDDFEYSNPLSIDELKESMISIYPNPTKDMLFIQCKSPINRIAILDTNGRLLKSESFSNSKKEYQTDLKDLSTGIYFMKIQTDSGILTHKIVKE